MRLQSALALLLLGSVPAALQVGVDAPALRSASTWPELVARDELLSFSTGSARDARELLVPEDPWSAAAPAVLDQALACLALGSGGDIRDRPTLEAFATAAESVAPEVRAAAALGLGELRPAPAPFLIELVDDGAPAVSSAAIVACARSDEAQALAALEAWSVADDERGRAAAGALAFVRGEAAASPGAHVNGFLALRWESAKLYGFVDGVRWQVHLEEELARDEAFLDTVILGAAAVLREGPRRDHLLEILLAGGTPERLRGLVAGASDVLGTLMEAGLWEPADAREWGALLDELASRPTRPEDLATLKAVAQVPQLAVRAGLMLVEAGVAEAFSLISEEMFAPEAERRLSAAQALGGVADPDRAIDLARLRRDRDGRVRAAAMVAQARRRDQDAINAMVDLLYGGESSPRSHLVEMMARTAHDPLVSSYLSDVVLLGDLEPAELMLVQVSLAAHGKSQPRGALREMLRSPELPPGLMVLIAEALGRSPDREDLAAMRSLYPIEGQRDANIQLARALIANRDPGAIGLLRAAVWRGSWNRSVLAAGLLVRHGGIQALHDELSSPPPRATDADLRRVGFALGEWGGLAEVDVLARRRRAGDPALQGAFLGALATRTQ